MFDLKIPLDPMVFGLDPSTHVATITHQPRQHSDRMYSLEVRGPGVPSRSNASRAVYVVTPPHHTQMVGTIEMFELLCSVRLKTSQGLPTLTVFRKDENVFAVMVRLFAAHYLKTPVDPEIPRSKVKR